MVGLWELITRTSECQDDFSGVQFIWIVLGIVTLTACMTWLIFGPRGRRYWWHPPVAALGILAAVAWITWGIILAAGR